MRAIPSATRKIDSWGLIPNQLAVAWEHRNHKEIIEAFVIKKLKEEILK